MQTLREVLEHTQEDGAAAGHFNIADLVLLKAVFAAAKELNSPVLVGRPKANAIFWGSVKLRSWFEVCGKSSTSPSS